MSSSDASHNLEGILISSISAQPWSTVIANPKSGSTLWGFQGVELQGQSVSYATLSPQGEFAILAVRGKPLLYCIGLASQDRVCQRSTLPGILSCAPAISPCGSVVCAAINERLILWFLGSGEMTAMIPAHYQPVSHVQFAVGGAFIISAGADGLLKAWNLSNLMAVSQKGAKPISAQSTMIGGDAGVKPYRKWHAHSLPITDMLLSPGGCANTSRVYSCSLDQTLHVHSLWNEERLLSFYFDSPVHSMAVDYAETRLFVGLANTMIVCLKICSVLTDDSVPVEKRGTVSKERTVQTPSDCITANDTEGNGWFQGHTGTVTALSVNLDGSYLASGSDDKTCRIWHISSHQLLRCFETLTGPISTVQFLTPNHCLLTVQRSADRAAENEANSVAKGAKSQLLSIPMQSLEKQVSMDIEKVKCRLSPNANHYTIDCDELHGNDKFAVHDAALKDRSSIVEQEDIEKAKTVLEDDEIGLGEAFDDIPVSFPSKKISPEMQFRTLTREQFLMKTNELFKPKRGRRRTSGSHQTYKSETFTTSNAVAATASSPYRVSPTYSSQFPVARPPRAVGFSRDRGTNAASRSSRSKDPAFLFTGPNNMPTFGSVTLPSEPNYHRGQQLQHQHYQGQSFTLPHRRPS